tara:strand:- start:149 stop:703 length:555 start_codon:yes stop_codon:yes gene_type:complete
MVIRRKVKKMIIDKEIVSKTYRQYFFISGVVDIDEKYFKKRIDEGVKNSSLNYNTNVIGKHTAWQFFNKDENFGIFLLQMIDYLEGLDISLQRFFLDEAWGIIEKFGDYTKRHHHGSAYLSGVLYIHDHHQKLFFPEINQEITPKKGRFVVFSSFLKHYTERNTQHKAKYAISFNCRNAMVSDT